MAQTSESGSAFEEQIADLYKLMGYSVDRNIRLAGQQIDLLARQYLRGSGPHTVLVECKFNGQGDKAGNADVQDIAGAWLTLRSQNAAAACVLVTNTDFTVGAKEAAGAAGITLLTYRELLFSLLDLSSYFAALRTDYRDRFGTAEDGWYIVPHGRREDGSSAPLDILVDEWLSSKPASPLALLGAYGTGKSAFCLHYANRLLDNPDAPLPIILRLRRMIGKTDVRSLVREFLELECNSQTPRYDSFIRMHREGVLLLLFDGFDEVASRVDRTVMEMHLAEIEQFTQQNSRVIVTCRPEFFITQQEERELLRPISDALSDRVAIYDRVKLSLWNTDQVRQYIKRRTTSSSIKEYITTEDASKFFSEPALQDITSRVVHLELATRLLFSLKGGKPLTRYSLYEGFIAKELAREAVQNRRLKAMSDMDRLRLLQRIAYQHYMGGADDLQLKLASELVASELGLESPDIEAVTRDFLNRSFLQRDGDTYTFAHRSINEYLVSMELARRLRNGDSTMIPQADWTGAIAGMTLDAVGGIDSFDEFLSLMGFGPEKEPNWVSQLKHLNFIALSIYESADAILSFSRRTILEQHLPRIWRDYYHVLHDLRNPIVTVRLCALALLESQGDNQGQEVDRQEVDRLIDIIRQNWRRALRMLNALRDYRDTGHFRPSMDFLLHRTPVELRRLLERATAIVSTSRLHLDVGESHYLGDEECLLRVFDNIISNACAFMGSAGSLMVRLNRDANRQYTSVSFANDGPLIPPELIPRIFEFGFSTRPGGHGIGLAVVDELIALHGGQVFARSEGKWTVFEVVLPDHVPQDQ